MRTRTRTRTNTREKERQRERERAQERPKSIQEHPKSSQELPRTYQNHQNSTPQDLPFASAEICTMSQGIRIRPSNHTVFYSTSKNESCWRRGENADFAITWGDVSGHLLFFDGSRSDPVRTPKTLFSILNGFAYIKP